MFARLGRLGPIRFVIPILFAFVMACLMGLMFYPMAHMSISNLPFAIVSLDEGMSTEQGETNAGETLVDTLIASTSSDDGDAMMVWTVLDSQEAMDEALENNEYYGYLVIPADFTQAQMAAQTGLGDVPTLEAYFDNAKSPMVASMLSTSFASMFEAMGMNVDSTIVHQGSDSSASSSVAMTSMMSGMYGSIIAITPMLTLSMTCAMLLTRVVSIRNITERGKRYRTIGLQALLVLIFSCIIGLIDCGLVTVAGGTSIPFVQMWTFAWLGSFCILILCVGLANINAGLEIVIAMLIMFLGMSSAMFAPEMLPAFWRDGLYPWVPQHFMGDGIRQILYMGANMFNNSTGPICIYGIIGIVILVLGGLIPRKPAPIMPSPEQIAALQQAAAAQQAAGQQGFNPQQAAAQGFAPQQAAGVPQGLTPEQIAAAQQAAAAAQQGAAQQGYTPQHGAGTTGGSDPQQQG